MGETALRCLVGVRGITKWRGSILEGREEIGGRKVIPILHPAFILRRYKWYPVFELDFRKVAREAETPTITHPKRTLLVAESMQNVREVVEMCKQGEHISIDIETRRNQIACVGFSIQPDLGWCIPITTAGGSRWELRDELEVWRAINEILMLPTPKIGQNYVSYDGLWFSRAGLKTRNFRYDTMFMQNVLYPEMPKGLDFMTSIYTGEPYYKDEVKDWKNIDDRVLYRYNARDAAVTYEVFLFLKKEMESAGAMKFYLNHTQRLFAPVFNAMARGMRFDVGKREKVARDTEKEVTRKNIELLQLTGRNLNVNSPKQMREYFYDHLGMLPITKAGKPTLDEDALIKLSRKYDHPALTLSLEIRKLRNLLSKDVNIDIDPDNRFRCNINIGGTNTGRFSSSKSAWDTGKNSQNIPEKARNLYVADEGYTLFVPDLEQAEDRWVTYLSEDTMTMESYAQGIDQHARTAEACFGKEALLRSEQAYEQYRRLGKTINHASNYLMGWKTFQNEVLKQLRIWLDAAEAKRLLAIRRAMRPQLVVWHAEVKRELEAVRTLVTPFGRKRTFFGRMNEATLREAVAFVPQSGVSDTMKQAIAWLYENHPWIFFLLDQHDGAVFQVPDERVEEAAPLVISAATIPVEIKGRELVVPVKLKTGKDWYNLEEWKQAA
jgi:DNA polymerase I-like protein with 3'-5' exonuclease and polymerase domains